MVFAQKLSSKCLATLSAAALELQGRVAIVTGGARGIGLEITSMFARAGARVVIADVLEGHASAAAERLSKEGLAVRQFPTDVTQRDDCSAVVAHVLETTGRIDILVNNAGVAAYGPSESFPEESWNRSIDVMLTGPFLASQAAAPPMIAQRRGVILNISSITGTGGWPLRAAYNAAKGGRHLPHSGTGNRVGAAQHWSTRSRPAPSTPNCCGRRSSKALPRAKATSGAFQAVGSDVSTTSQMPRCSLSPTVRATSPELTSVSTVVG